MPTLAQLRSKANKLIAQGRKKLERREATDRRATVTTKNLKTKRTAKRAVRLPPIEGEDYWLVYEDARDLLLTHGYEKSLDEDVQALYSELIPENYAFERASKGILKELRSRTVPTRQAAARRMLKETCDVVTREQNLWLRHPETVAALIKAFGRESDSKAASDLALALGGVYDRYLADLRIFPALFPHMDSEDKSVRVAAVRATKSCPDREKWPKVLEILESLPAQPLLRAASAHVRAGAVGKDPFEQGPLRGPLSLKRQLLPVLLANAERKLSDDARAELHGALAAVLVPQTAEAFQAEAGKRIQNAFGKWLRTRASGPRRDFLQSLL